MNASRTRTPSTTVESALLAAAARVLETEGPEALTVRHIAKEAGVAPMGVYSRFESKAGIIEALFRLGFQTLAEEFSTLDDFGDPIDALFEAGRRYRLLAIAHPRIYQLMFDRSIPGFEPSESAKIDAARAFEGLVHVVRRAIDAGVAHSEDPALLAQVIWASCHGWVSLELAGIGFVQDTASGYEALCRALLDGISSSEIS